MDREIRLQLKQVMGSFRCYDNSNVIVTLIKTNFYLYRIQLWLCFNFGGEFLQVFIKGDVVYAQT